MAERKYDVLAIGNAIVDVLAQADDAFLVSEKLVKGSMHLIEADRAETLYDTMGPGQLISGGCAGNTAAGVASLGGSAAFIGKVADDELGHFYRHDMQSVGIAFPAKPLAEGAPTARCLILITPDSERTMNTYLGACQELTSADIDKATVEAAEITYLEGYLWDPPKAKEAFRTASEIAHGAGRKVALTLSDSFCVDRFRSEFLELMRSGVVDVVFANNHEVLALYETSDLATGIESLAADVGLAAVTLGAEGSLVVRGGERINVPAPEVETILDKTGAGDLFASGFLFGLARNAPLGRCAELGSLAAGEIISHLGARPQASLQSLAEQQRLLAGVSA
ncbi:adenosine kinase [Afifella marina]|uniref:Sugar or nucleoside kinase, ribokinase family n=1 Tax=Afifella marina DSM 2698 TaxID=1120955 RepID=A0A1G5NDM3_AFIMA|nr:adenosine kinase [Afifella marina]MBK1623372.1 adenosine kinase [Afifella marina DSM 2698]MBK1626366.1 adenosine kinase [Afifella marina]MBK5917244.1 adenosine kinase [Afifella marina]RAI18101.1 adenosine kinase [Afifella marina DSM 2698]SCZ35506.1 Sugar or nucleoside kinase, ribokinase family [Afifella marina DSM 2698]